jgi:putative transposase
MLRKTRKQYPSSLKAKIVIEALRETKTISELAAEYQIHPNLITKWKLSAVAELPKLFERGVVKDETVEAQEVKISELYQEIGKLATQVNWLKKKSGLQPDA